MSFVEEGDAVSVVVPVHNEAPIIRFVLEDLYREIVERLPGSEIVVVDDRSTDGTPEILDRFAAEHSPVTIEHATSNRGHGPTVTRAVRSAERSWIFHIDSDGQFLAEDFWKLWDVRDRADLILGVRVDRRDPQHRLLLTKIVAAVTSVLAGKRLADPNIPFKLFRREVWDDVGSLLTTETLAPSILLVLGAARRGWRIVEVPVRHLPRAHGTSSLQAVRLLRFSFLGLLQLVRFRLDVRRSSKRSL